MHILHSLLLPTPSCLAFNASNSFDLLLLLWNITIRVSSLALPRPESFPLLELPGDVVARIASSSENYGALMLWITGDRQLQGILKEQTTQLSAVLPAGFWAIPWALVRNFESTRELKIGLPRFAHSWSFADMDNFLPLVHLQRLTIQNGSMLRHMAKASILEPESFPQLTHLIIFLGSAPELSAATAWSLPKKLEHFEVNTPDFPSSSSRTNSIKLKSAPWLTKLPDTVRHLHLRLALGFCFGYDAPPFRWPNKLETVTIGFDCSYAPNIEPCERGPVEEVPTTPSSAASPLSSANISTATSSKATSSDKPQFDSTIDYAKAMREAKKAERAAANSPTPAPSAEVPLAPLPVANPFYELPPTVTHVDMMLLSHRRALVEPDSLPPRIRFFRLQADDDIYTSYTPEQFYQARPTLRFLDVGYQRYRNGCTLTTAALQAMPCYAQYMNVLLAPNAIPVARFTKMLHPSVTELDLHYGYKDEETLSALPRQLKTLRLHLSSAISVRLPPGLTSLENAGLGNSGRFKSNVYFPASLTTLEMGYFHSGNFTRFPSNLTRLSFSINADRIAASDGSARHLPRTLRYLSVGLNGHWGFSSRSIKWWSEIPSDCPLETLSINYSDYQDDHPRIHGPPPLPFIHPTLHSLHVTLFEIPLETAVHVLSNLPKQLYKLCFGVFRGNASLNRPCPTVPGTLIDTLPPLLDSLRSNLFDKEAIQRWHRQLAARKAETFNDNPNLYVYNHEV